MRSGCAGISLDVGGSTHVHHVDQGIGLSEVVQELVSQSFPLPRIGDQSSYIQEFHGNHPGPVHAK